MSAKVSSTASLVPKEVAPSVTCPEKAWSRNAFTSGRFGFEKRAFPGATCSHVKPIVSRRPRTSRSHSSTLPFASYSQRTDGCLTQKRRAGPFPESVVITSSSRNVAGMATSSASRKRVWSQAGTMPARTRPARIHGETTSAASAIRK